MYVIVKIFNCTVNLSYILVAIMEITKAKAFRFKKLSNRDTQWSHKSCNIIIYLIIKGKIDK